MQNQEPNNIEEKLKNESQGLIKFIEIGSKTSIHNLEYWVRILNANSSLNEHSIDGKRLPEYQQAIDALIRYRDALINKINELYK